MPAGPLFRTVLATLAILAGSALLAGAVIVYGGFIDVAASSQHGPVTRWLLETARLRSIAAHARGTAVPDGLDDPKNLTFGVEHFAAHCAVCHGAPGVPKGDIALGMYPAPPDLALSAKQYSEAELFWIIRHGIKMTGMPAWPDHTDAEIWAIVAFLRKLGSGMTEQQYAELIQSALIHGGHQHAAPEGSHQQ